MSEDNLLSELQLLTSMYSPSDIHFDDPEILLRIDNSLPILGSVSLTVKLNESLEVNLRIPSGYTNTNETHGEHVVESISAHCSSSHTEIGCVNSLSRLNQELGLVTKNGINGEPCDILSIINWCSERWDELVEECTNERSSSSCTTSNQDSDSLCRIWIHSHHIYNEKKRKFIVENASNLSLSGFSLPGKPGFICVEGTVQNCDEFWSRVRQLTWQKISLIEKEILVDASGTESNKELLTAAFSPNDFTELHFDKSAFMKYLNDKGISVVIKRYLGF